MSGNETFIFSQTLRFTKIIVKVRYFSLRYSILILIPSSAMYDSAHLTRCLSNNIYVRDCLHVGLITHI